MKNIFSLIPILLIISVIFCYNLFGNDGFRHEYPSIINLFWINEERNMSQTFIFPLDKKSEVLSSLFGWAEKNPEKTMVQLWYDSALISSKAVENTQELISNYCNENELSAPILLQDLRSISLIKKNSDILNDNIPLFFCIDLVRLIVIWSQITEWGASYAMSTDIDVLPTAYEELYDEETQFQLEKYGIVLARVDLSKTVARKLGLSPKKDEYAFENGFQILSHHNQNLLKALKLVLIDVQLEIARGLFRQHRSTYSPVFANMVLFHYKRMFDYFFALEENKNVLIPIGGNKEIYNRDIHGLMPFVEPTVLIFPVCNAFCIPTKKVEIPQSRMGNPWRPYKKCPIKFSKSKGHNLKKEL